MFPAAPVAARFDIGRVISRAFTVVGRNFLPFFVCATIFAGLPALLVGLLQLGAGDGNAATAGAVVAGLLALPVTMIGATLLQATVVHGAVSELNGRRASIGESLAASVRLILPLVGLAIVVGVLTGVATLALIVPGFIVAVIFSVSAPVLIVERLGVTRSMSRSADLTRGHRWAIFGLWVLFFIGAMIVGAVLGGVSGAFGALANVGEFERLQVLVVTPVSQTVTTLFSAAGTASIYYELRFIKEGVGLEALAAVFD